MEKRSKRMTTLAMKAQDRRCDWMRHTLNVIEADVKRGGEQEIKQAQTIAKGK